MKRFFITATGTGVGKTLVTTALCHQWTQQKKRVVALKPLVSGFRDDGASDSALILQSLGKPSAMTDIAVISPWRWSAPLSPHMAIRQEGNEASLAAVTQFCDAYTPGEYDVMLIEGAGGLMSPINSTHTNCDWIKALACPAILVAGSYLGSITHTITALHVLQSESIPVSAVVISESEAEAVDLQATAESIQHFAKLSCPVYTIPRLPPGPERWRHAPNLLNI